MWLSSKMRPAPAAADADLGVTTIAGGSVGVMTRGEVRTVPIYGPGGYVWMPGSGAAVLVVKGGPGGEEQCVSGMKQCAPPKGMQPGEVLVYGPGGNSVYLKSDGTLELRGKVCVEGSLWINGAACSPCLCGEELL